MAIRQITGRDIGSSWTGDHLTVYEKIHGDGNDPGELCVIPAAGHPPAPLTGDVGRGCGDASCALLSFGPAFGRIPPPIRPNLFSIGTRVSRHQPGCLAMKSRISRAISSVFSSSAKWPASSKCISASGRSVLNGAGRRKRRVVRSPCHQGGRLVLAQPCLPLRIGGDVGTVVVEQRCLDLALTWLG